MQANGIELLFPSRAIENLKNLRSERWETLISHLLNQEPTSPDIIGFVLLMVRLAGCASCQADSYRAMRGCSLCSITTIKRYKGTDQTLIDLYNEAKKDVIKYMSEV